MQDCKYVSGLQFIKFNFVTGRQEIKVSIPGGNLRFFLMVILPFKFIFLCNHHFWQFFLPILR